MCIEKLAIATVLDHAVALATKLGIAVVDHDIDAEERLARAAAATVLLAIRAMCNNAT